MPPFNTWVIKLGGALLAAGELRDWLAACEADLPAARCVVVTGGGALANEVRALQARWGFDDRLAHELAIDTMRTNARVLHALAPRLLPCTALTAADLPDAASANCLWSPPRDFAPSELPLSWAVTSDSIALWLAKALGAQALLLVKSLAPMDLQAAVDGDLAAAGVVDDYFSTLLGTTALPVRVISKYSVADFSAQRSRGEPPGMSVSRR